MVLALWAACEALDDDLIEAAFDLGATRAQAFRRVILPLTSPGLLAGSLMVLVLVAGDYLTPSSSAAAAASPSPAPSTTCSAPPSTGPWPRPSPGFCWRRSPSWSPPPSSSSPAALGPGCGHPLMRDRLEPLLTTYVWLVYTFMYAPILLMGLFSLNSSELMTFPLEHFTCAGMARP